MNEKRQDLRNIAKLSVNEIADIFSNNGELILDSFVKSDLLKDIPVIGNALSVIKIGANISNYLFLKKLAGFLFELEKIPVERRKDFFNKINEKECNKLGDSILLLLDRLNDLSKAKMLGCAFRACIEGDFPYDAFRRVCSAIDKVDLVSVPSLVAFYSKDASCPAPKELDLQGLAMAGLVSIYFASGAIAGGSGGYRENIVGEDFIKFALCT